MTAALSDCSEYFECPSGIPCSVSLAFSTWVNVGVEGLSKRALVGRMRASATVESQHRALGPS